MRICLLVDASSIHSTRWVESLKIDNDILVISPEEFNILGVEKYVYRPVRPRLGLGGSLYRITAGLILLSIAKFSPEGFIRKQLLWLEKLGFQSRGIADEVLRFNPDVIHLHYLSRWDDSLALLALPPEKEVISVWGDDIEEQVGKQSFLTKSLRRKILRRVKLVTSTSGYLAEKTNRYSGGGVFPYIVPFGVDLNLFHPVSKKSSKLVVGFIKPTEWVYGSDLILPSISNLVNDHLNPELWVVGKVSDKFKDQARKLGLENRIKYFGQVEHKRIAEIMPKIGILLLPSRFETFGVSVVEAQACGIPAVVSSAGGLSEVVLDGITGRVLTSPTPSSTSSAIEDVWRNRGDYSREARLNSEKRFNWSDNISLMEDLYEKIVNGGKKVVMVVTNSVYLDNRVRKEAGAVSEVGTFVTVFGMLEPGEKRPRWEMLGDFLVVRTQKDINLSVGGFRAFLKKALHLSEIIFYGGVSLAKLHSVVRSFPADIYHAHDLDTLLICGLSSRTNRAKLIFDAHEMFIEAMRDSLNEKVRNNKYLQLLILLVIRTNLVIVRAFFVRRADLIITVSDSIARRFVWKYHVHKKPLLVLNAWENTMMPNDPGKMRRILKISNDKIVLIYQGGIIEGRGLEAIVRAVPRLPQEMVVVFLGYGKLVPHLKELSAELRLTNRVFFLEAVQPNDLLNYTSSADVGLLTLEAINLNNVYAMPNKLFEYLAAGIAIITPDFPDMSEVVKKGVGQTFKHDNWDDLVRVIKDVADPKKIARYKARSAKLFEDEYNWEAQREKLQSAYRKLLR